MLAGLAVLALLGAGALSTASAYYGVPARELMAHGPQRVLPVVKVGRATGSYAFVRTQPGDPSEPVTYNPCRRIAVELNPASAPAGAQRLVTGALDAVSRATGLSLVLVGTTDRDPAAARAEAASSRMRLGRSSEPVLIAWSTPEETPELRGDVAGLAGSTARASLGGGRLTYVTGTVVLDGPGLAQTAKQPGGRALVRAVLLHELGHLVGLDHVEDPGELMYRASLGRTGFGPGDLAGLARLGAGPCRG